MENIKPDLDFESESRGRTLLPIATNETCPYKCGFVSMYPINPTIRSINQITHFARAIYKDVLEMLRLMI